MLDNYAKGTLAPVETKSVPSSPAPAIDVMIRRHASILAKCRREVLAAMGNVGEEIVEKYAVTMFLAIQKQLAEF